MQNEKLPSCAGISVKWGERSWMLCRRQQNLIRAILPRMHQPDNAKQMLHLWRGNRYSNILKILTPFIYNLQIHVWRENNGKKKITKLRPFEGIREGGKQSKYHFLQILNHVHYPEESRGELLCLQNIISTSVHITSLLSASIDFSMNTKHCFVRHPWQGTDCSKNISSFIRLNLLAGRFYMQKAKNNNNNKKNTTFLHSHLLHMLFL